MEKFFTSTMVKCPNPYCTRKEPVYYLGVCPDCGCDLEEELKKKEFKKKWDLERKLEKELKRKIKEELKKKRDEEYKEFEKKRDEEFKKKMEKEETEYHKCQKCKTNYEVRYNGYGVTFWPKNCTHCGYKITCHRFCDKGHSGQPLIEGKKRWHCPQCTHQDRIKLDGIKLKYKYQREQQQEEQNKIKIAAEHEYYWKQQQEEEEYGNKFDKFSTWDDPRAGAYE